MRRTSIVFLLAAVALCCAARSSTGQVVDLSLNVFPTNLSNPDGGGTWNVVAKTSGGSPNLGIVGISVYLMNVNLAGIMVEPDINSITRPNGEPFAGVISGAVNILYAQDITQAPIIPGVGMAAFSDGPDPLGDPAWDGATRIFKGTYSAASPTWAVGPITVTDANVLASTTPGTAAIDAITTIVARIQVPEPAGASLAVAGMLATTVVRRRFRTD